MSTTLIRSLSAVIIVAALAACSSTARTPPSAAAAPSTDVNPITGSRGGSGAR